MALILPQNWHLPKQTRKTNPTNLPKLAFPSIMPSRTTPENLSSKTDTARWRFNGTGQFVDAEAASAEWDLADDIVNLKIGGDVVNGPIRTPPQNKIAAAAVVQLNEASPLETSSDTSLDSSEHPSDHQITISHSRESSADTTISSAHESVASHTMRGHPPLKVNTGEAKERPHSFSGGLSTADLRRLQQAGEVSAGGQSGEWSSAHYRDTIGPNDKQFPADQPTYPSLANQSQHRPQQYDYRSVPVSGPTADEMADYNIQQRNFNPAATMHPFVAGRINNPPIPNVSYRQPGRNYPQGLVPSPTNMGYPPHHASHLSLGNTQQLYDMMLPPHPESHHPAVTRVQQQHNVFRAGHQHSASDPSAIRDAATLALLNNNMQTFGPAGPAMFPPTMAPAMSLYANQFYAAQEAYPRNDVAVQAMARLQSPYTGQYAMVPQGMEISMSGPGLASPTGNGPSANNRKLGLYKTELCRSWEEKGTCRYGAKCQFAHGEEELRKVARHPKYKTEICRVRIRAVYTGFHAHLFPCRHSGCQDHALTASAAALFTLSSPLQAHRPVLRVHHHHPRLTGAHGQ